MNTDTGKIYYGLHEIEAARRRGEPIVEITPEQAALAEEIAAMPEVPSLNRAQRRAQFGGKNSRRSRIAESLPTRRYE